MFIKQVEIENFRSFRDKTAIDFEEGFNVIVGQNGAGKSTILAAICWALGYENYKSQPIFDGAGQEAVRHSPTVVSVTLDNSDGRAPQFSPDDVRVTRYQSSSRNDWNVNGQKYSSQQLHSMLDGCGMWQATPYNVVKQGTVTNLATSTDRERLRYIFEATGLQVFDKRMDRALELFSQTVVERRNAEHVLAALDREYEIVKRLNAEFAEQRVHVSNKRSAEYVLLRRAFDETQDKLKELLASFAKRNEIHDAEVEVIRARARVEEAELALASERDNMQRGQIDRIQSQEQHESLVDELVKKQAELTTNLELDQCELELVDGAIAEFDDVQSSFLSMSEEVKKATAELEKAQKTVDDAKEAMTRAENSHSAHAMRELQQKSPEEMEQLMSRYNGRMTDLHADVDRLTEDRVQQTKRLKSTKERLEDERRFVGEKIRERNELKKSRGQLKSTVQDLLTGVREMERRVEGRRKEALDLMETKRQTFDKFAAIVGRGVARGVEAVQQLVREIADKEEGVRSQQETRFLKGYHGMFFQSLQIPEVMHGAVEAAARSKLFRHIVDDSTTALDIIALLTQREAGARFNGAPEFQDMSRILHLSKKRKGGQHSLPFTNKDIDKLTDHVLVKEDLAAASSEGIELLRRDVFDRVYLLTKPGARLDNETAKIARDNNVLIVSMDGDRQHSSGVIHGGFYAADHHSSITAYTKWKDCVNELHSTQLLLSTDEADLDEKVTALREVEEQLATVEQTVDAVNCECAVFEARFPIDLRSISDAEQSIAALDAQIRESKQQIDDLQVKLDHLSRVSSSSLSPDQGNFSQEIYYARCAYDNAREEQLKKSSALEALNGPLRQMEERHSKLLAVLGNDKEETKKSLEKLIERHTSKLNDVAAKLKDLYKERRHAIGDRIDRNEVAAQNLAALETNVEMRVADVAKAEQELESLKRRCVKHLDEEARLSNKLHALNQRINEFGVLPNTRQHEQLTDSELRDEIDRAGEHLRKLALNVKDVDPRLQSKVDELERQRTDLSNRVKRADVDKEAIEKLTKHLREARRTAVLKQLEKVDAYFTALVKLLLQDTVMARLILFASRPPAAAAAENSSSSGDQSDEMDMDGPEGEGDDRPRSKRRRRTPQGDSAQSGRQATDDSQDDDDDESAVITIGVSELSSSLSSLRDGDFDERILERIQGVGVNVRRLHDGMDISLADLATSQQVTSSSSSQPLQQLSGGQRTSIALALVLAVQSVEPSPFFLFDEVDAALDHNTREQLGLAIHHRCEENRHTQFIVTTFRPELVMCGTRHFLVEQAGVSGPRGATNSSLSTVRPVTRDMALEQVRSRHGLGRRA